MFYDRPRRVACSGCPLIPLAKWRCRLADSLDRSQIKRDSAEVRNVTVYRVVAYNIACKNHAARGSGRAAVYLVMFPF